LSIQAPTTKENYYRLGSQADGHFPLTTSEVTQDVKGGARSEFGPEHWRKKCVSFSNHLIGTILVKPVILVEPVDLDRNFSFGIMSSPQFDLGDNPSILKNDLY